jgi:hypothetical protein
MSAANLATFDVAVFHDRMLSRQTLELMWTPFRLNDGREGEFARGWNTDVLNSHRMVFHIGAGIVEYAHLLGPALSVIPFTKNQCFNPYRMTKDLPTSNTIHTKFPRLKNAVSVGPIVDLPRFSP